MQLSIASYNIRDICLGADPEIYQLRWWLALDSSWVTWVFHYHENYHVEFNVEG